MAEARAPGPAYAEPMRLPLKVALFCGAIALACSSEPTAGAGNAGASDAGRDQTSDATDGATADALDTGTQPECEGEQGTLGVCLKSVSGSVVDETGQPLKDLALSVCGAQCFYGKTDSTGGFSVEAGYFINPTGYSVSPHGRPFRPTYYFPLLPLVDGHVEMGELRVLEFPSDSAELVVKNDLMGAAPPAQSVTASGVTLTVPAGVRVDIDIEDVSAGADGRRFRVLKVADAVVGEFVPSEYGLSVVYALGPFEAGFSVAGPPIETRTAQLSFPNDAGWPADTEVEIHALGSYLYPDWVPPATFAKVAVARVTTTGDRIEMLPGEGVERLTWIGLKAKP